MKYASFADPVLGLQSYISIGLLAKSVDPDDPKGNVEKVLDFLGLDKGLADEVCTVCGDEYEEFISGDWVERWVLARER